AGPRAIPRPSRLILTWLGGSFTVILGTLLILAALNVRLGQGYFAYLYSPIRNQRVVRMLPILLVGLIACGAIRLATFPKAQARWGGIATLLACAVLAGIWSFWAPPQPFTQQMFNMTSLSTDGAFVFEARQFTSMRDYLRHFPQRLNASVEQMGSTRVLSNPPGMTMIARATISAFAHPASDPPDWLERRLIARENIDPPDAGPLAGALRVGMVLCALWMISAIMAYALGRLFLSPQGAAGFVII